jgi:hypothetical protein
VIWDAERRRLQQQFDAFGIPERTVETLVEYIVTGRPCGSFVQAVLNNDLLDAVRRGDVPSQFHLIDIMKVLVNHAPAGCFGHEGAHDAWVARGGLQGKEAPVGP